MTALRDAPATSRNREPILRVLRERFADRDRVLEIGSGSGQHAAFLAAALPHLIWQCSDRAENLADIRARLADAALANTPPPLQLDVARDAWPAMRYDAVFSANTLHIMSWPEVECLFSGLDGVLAADAMVIMYGPFNVDGAFTSPSNAAFDVSLRMSASHMGIRDLEAVDALAAGIGLDRQANIAMPANNRCIVWKRTQRAAV